MQFKNIKIIAASKDYFIGQEEDTLYKINKDSIESEVELNKSYNFYLDENELEVFYKDDRHFKILLELEKIKNEVLSIKKDQSDNLFLSTQIGTSLLVEQFSKEDFESLDLEGNDLSIHMNIKTIMRVKRLQERD